MHCIGFGFVFPCSGLTECFLVGVKRGDVFTIHLVIVCLV